MEVPQQAKWMMVDDGGIAEIQAAGSCPQTRLTPGRTTPIGTEFGRRTSGGRNMARGRRVYPDRE